MKQEELKHVSTFGQAVRRFLQLLSLEREEIASIYWLAAISGVLYLMIPLCLQAIIGFVLSGSFSTSLIILIAAVVTAVFLNGLFEVKQLEVIEKIEQKIFLRYAFTYADQLPKIDVQKNDDYYMPELVNRFFEISTLQKSIYKLLIDIPGAALQIVLGTLLLSFYHPFFIGFGILLLFIVFMIIRITSPLGYASAVKTSDLKYKIGDWLEQISRNVKLFKLNSHLNFHLIRTDQLAIEYIQNKTDLFKILRIQYWSMIAFKMLIFLSLLILGVGLLLKQQINIGQFLASDIVIIGIIASVEKFIQNFDKVYLSITSIEKLNKILNVETEQSGQLLLAPPHKGMEIEFKQVSFSYNPSVRVLQNIDLHLAPGEWGQILGKKGSGKTSVFNLISGSYQNFSGNILINGIPIVNYNIAELRKHMAALLQENTLIEGTLLDNICLQQSCDVSLLTNIAEYTGLMKHISMLKDGFNTKVSAYRHSLEPALIRSVLLTRALYTQPLLLLLEDPFLDMNETESDRLIQYIKALPQKPTVLIINNNQTAYPFIDKHFLIQR